MGSWNHFLTLLLAGAGTLHGAEPTPGVLKRFYRLRGQP